MCYALQEIEPHLHKCTSALMVAAKHLSSNFGSYMLEIERLLSTQHLKSRVLRNLCLLGSAMYALADVGGWFSKEDVNAWMVSSVSPYNMKAVQTFNVEQEVSSELAFSDCNSFLTAINFGAGCKLHLAVRLLESYCLGLQVAEGRCSIARLNGVCNSDALGTNA